MHISDFPNTHTATHRRDGMMLSGIHWKYGRLTVGCLSSVGTHFKKKRAGSAATASLSQDTLTQ